ncbi:MAG: hypothetical protein RI947_451 [Candidatus Parcubacteria bacterium]|jgi:fucose 4-O-acetylase-like acetyltransferase
MKERNKMIDILRALAVLIMILTHSLVPYLSQPHLYKLWDLIHFAVPMFVFCSGYIFYAGADKLKKIRYVPYILKRVYRLMIPYYIYAFAYIIFVSWTGGLTVTPAYMLSVITATGGIDISWLVLLFLFFSLLTPLYLKVHTNRLVRWGYLSIAVITSALLLFLNPSMSYKWYMWIPWSIPFIYGYVFIQYQTKKGYLWKSSVLLAVLFVASYILRLQLHRSTQLFNNKYPPTLLYISHGLLWINLICAIVQNIKLPSVVTVLASFLSRFSYSLFFIHYFIILVASHMGLPRKLHWFVFALCITISSLGVQWAGSFVFRRRKA